MLIGISLIVTKGQPKELEKRWGSKIYWGRHRNVENPIKDFFAARIHHRSGKHTHNDWWLVVRPCEELLSQSEFSGQPAITVYSGPPFDFFDEVPEDSEGFFEPIMSKLSTVKETEYCFDDIIWWATRWTKQPVRDDIIKTVLNTEWFLEGSSSDPAYIVTYAQEKEDFIEAAKLAERYDPLCAGYLYKKKWNRILSRRGVLLIARPASSSGERMPIIGCIGVLSNRKEHPKKIYYLCCLAVHPEFRRLGLATRLLWQIQKLGDAPVVVHLPHTYTEGLEFLKGYQEKQDCKVIASLTKGKDMKELQSVDWDAYRFEIT